MSSFITIEGCAEAEIIEKKSRFIGAIAHVETEQEALDFLEEKRAQHRMARHNVYAYVVQGDGSVPRIRYSDDGEPQKTAGMPTLEAIQHANLVDVVVVVTRYFGGTLLGTGGLVRAYTQATQAAIEAANKVTISCCVDVTISLPYSSFDQVQHLVEVSGGKIVDTQYTDSVKVIVRFLEGEQEHFVTKIIELTSGQVTPYVSDAFNAAF
ncbi:MAG: YigZ family protein [Anaerotardibacter sp.]